MLSAKESKSAEVHVLLFDNLSVFWFFVSLFIIN